MSPQTVSHTFIVTQRENGGHRTLWIYLLSISQPRAIFQEHRNHRRSWGYVLNCHQSLHKSRKALLMLLWSTLLFLPPFQQLIPFLQYPGRFWAAPREQGLWEKDVCLFWRSMGIIYLDWEEKQYLQHFRVSKYTFGYLCQIYGSYFKKQTTLLQPSLTFSFGRSTENHFHTLPNITMVVTVTAAAAVIATTTLGLRWHGMKHESDNRRNMTSPLLSFSP